MTGQRVGYIRVSTVEQNTERQLDGAQLDRSFTDKASGKDMQRPQLAAMLEFVREGDTVVTIRDIEAGRRTVLAGSQLQHVERTGLGGLFAP